MTKNATVIRERGVNLDGEHHPQGTVLGLPHNQFEDLEGVGIVREASDAEVRGSERRAANKPAGEPRMDKAEPVLMHAAAPPAD